MQCYHTWKLSVPCKMVQISLNDFLAVILWAHQWIRMNSSESKYLRCYFFFFKGNSTLESEKMETNCQGNKFEEYHPVP